MKIAQNLEFTAKRFVRNLPLKCFIYEKLLVFEKKQKIVTPT